MNGHDVALVFDALAHKGFCPGHVLDTSLDASRAQTSREHDEMFVASKSGIHHFGEFTTLMSGLVDGYKEWGDAREVHEEVICQIANLSIVVSSEDSTKYHAIGTSKGMVAHKGETASVGIGG